MSEHSYHGATSRSLTDKESSTSGSAAFKLVPMDNVKSIFPEFSFKIVFEGYLYIVIWLYSVRYMV